MNPLLLAAAAARNDDSLRAMLATLFLDESAPNGREGLSKSQLISQGLALLNNFTTMSPLHIACLHGRHTNVSLLLSHGASVHVRDVQGHTALYYACVAKDVSGKEKLMMIRTLKDAGAHFVGEEQGGKPAGVEEEIWDGATADV